MSFQVTGSGRYRARSFFAALLFAWAPPVYAENAVPWVKLNVPFVPTPPQVVDAMLKAATVKPDDIIYDLGSGDGRIVIAAVRDYGVKKGVGIDLNPKRVVEANENAKAAGVTDRATFVQGDVFKEDFSTATVVTMYLFDNVNLRLRPRILNELKPGRRVVSHQFHMFDWVPDNTVMVGKVPVYFWIVPAKIQGSWQGKIGADASKLELTQHIQDLSGSIAVGETTGAIAKTKMVGDRLMFDAVAARGGRDVPVHFEGKAVADTITGTLNVDGVRHAVTLRRAD